MMIFFDSCWNFTFESVWCTR